MKRLFPWGAVRLALLACAGTGALAATLNDGSSTNLVVRFANLEETTSDATTVLTPSADASGPFLLAEQIPGFAEPFPPLRTAWYAANARLTGGVYRVAAEFRPAAAQAERQGGVIGWLNLATSNGLIFKVVAADTVQGPGFRVAHVDFNGVTPAANENLARLYNTNGTAATPDIASAWSELGTNYVWENFAALELSFTAPTAADRAALPSATARLGARVLQPPTTGGAARPVSRTIELLTDLPVPGAADHRVGYFGVWSSIVRPGSVIGHYRLLEAEGNLELRTNAPPSVQLTQPTNAATYSEPASVPLAADATDTDGTVVQVEFLAGTNALVRLTNAPFAATWTNVLAGSYTLTAVATDNEGLSVTSAPVRITVVPPSTEAPTLTITPRQDLLDIAWGRTGFQLQYRTTIDQVGWLDVPNTITATQVTLPASLGAQYFRLVGSGAPAAPALTIEVAGTSVAVSWPAGVTGYRLQAKGALDALAWTDLPATNNRYVDDTAPGARFYRLVNP